MNSKTNAHTTNFNNDFSLPHNEQTEQAVIGALLTEKTAIYEIMDFLKPEMFYNSFCKTVYQAILNVELHSEVDLVTVARELQKGDDKVDMHKLATISTNIGSATHIEVHARLVYQDYLRREFMLRCAEGLANSKDMSIDVDDLMIDHTYRIENLSNSVDNKQTIHISEIVKDALANYQDRAHKAEKGEAPGLHTGLNKLDRAIHGFQKGAVYILAGRPGMGKTAFALHIARKTAKHGNNVVVFALEMTKESLINRMIIAESGINSDMFKQGRLNSDELQQLTSGADTIQHLPIHINDNAGSTIQSIRAEAKKLKRNGECDIIIIDYLQLIDMQIKGKNRNDEVSIISRNLKLMAKDLDVPVLLLSQLNREVERRGDKIPMLSDLRDSGSIEQDADVVMFIYRGSVHDQNESRNTGLIRIAKNRENQTGDVSFWVADDVTDFKDDNGFHVAETKPF